MIELRPALRAHLIRHGWIPPRVDYGLMWHQLRRQYERLHWYCVYKQEVIAWVEETKNFFKYDSRYFVTLEAAQLAAELRYCKDTGLVHPTQLVSAA